MEEQYFALLIDADNVSAKYIKPILTELSKYGIITYKRIYGDWTSTQHSSWKDELLTNSITPIQQFSYTQGKNSTDSAMIIDAMDILYTNDVDGFCIVSSDSDFTRLVSRLRESGKMVIGMGENKTPQELDFERKHEEYLHRIQNLRLIDDNFMTKVFEDKECSEFLLQVILDRDDLTIREVHSQYGLNNIQGRSARLDILAVDEQNKAYNIEIQRNDRGAEVRRARYNSGLMDANITSSGSSYDALNEAYVIFITENDVLKAGLPIYHIHRMVEETGAVFNDQSHIIYVNSQIKDDTKLGRLMQDFTCTNPDDMNYPVLAQRVRYFKEDTKGVATMCRAFEEVREETKREQAIESAKTMLADGLPYEQIARYTKLSIEEVKALDTKKPA